MQDMHDQELACEPAAVSALTPRRSQFPERAAVNEVFPTPRTAGASILTLARTAARVLQAKRLLRLSERVGVCLSLLTDDEPHPALDLLKEALAVLPVDEKHYWAGTLYTLLLPPATRRSQATYFTPPALAESVIDLAVAAGFDLWSHRVLDPAAGGAAFLSTIAGRRAALGVPRAKALAALQGIEIDPGLAELSRALIALRLGGPVPDQTIRVGDALVSAAHSEYDLVIVNPPYGRMSPTAVSGVEWKHFAHSGHLNKYALFADLSLRHAKKSGLVALVVPSSLRAGPLYDKLRAHIREQGQVLVIGTVGEREGVFADVQQDVSVILVRKGAAHNPAALVKFPVLPFSTIPEATAHLPSGVKEPWPTPIIDDAHIGGATLSDYGVEVRSGYFVWNREGERLSSRASRHAFPLIWAKNVKAGSFCKPRDRTGKKVDFVTFGGDSQAIIRGPAAVLQRTTNDKQPRRLVAAAVHPTVVCTWGGFVTENHTIVLTAKTFADIKLVVALLNTRAVDDRYRKVSGTAAVSVTLLRNLDLPQPETFKNALKATGGDAEMAANAAYARRISGGG